MSDSVVVGLLSLAGTLLGSLAGIATSAKLVVYRLEQLEKKVQAHNSLIERMYKVEGRLTEVEHGLDELRR